MSRYYIVKQGTRNRNNSYLVIYICLLFLCVWERGKEQSQTLHTNKWYQAVREKLLHDHVQFSSFNLRLSKQQIWNELTTRALEGRRAISGAHLTLRYTVAEQSGHAFFRPRKDLRRERKRLVGSLALIISVRLFTDLSPARIAHTFPRAKKRCHQSPDNEGLLASW